MTTEIVPGWICPDCQTMQYNKYRPNHSDGTCKEAQRGKELPAGLHDWWMAHQHAPALIYHKAAATQIMFMRDRFPHLFKDCWNSPPYSSSCRGTIEQYEQEREDKLNQVKVISTHTSKSCLLPVYEFTIPNLRLTMRDNFYNWKVSVEGHKPFAINHFQLFSPGTKHRPVYFEGFPEDRCFGSYTENPSRFSVEIGGEMEVYTFLWRIAAQLTK